MPDLRGAEWAFIPRDDPEVDGLYGSGELVSLNALVFWGDGEVKRRCANDG